MRVDGGSGVLINPAEGDFSYIITAKHVIELGDKYKSHQDIVVKNLSCELIPLESVFIHSSADLAVLITQEKYENKLEISNTSAIRGDTLFIYGFPNTRIGENLQSDRIREYSGIVQSFNQEKFIVSLEDSPDYDQLVGISGGGVFKVVGDDIFLCGIESRKHGNVQSEFHGNIECIQLNKIEELIEKNNLPKIYPEKMHNFIKLVRSSFSYFQNADEPAYIEFLTNSLHSYADKFSENGPTPIEISSRLKNKLLISNSPLQELYHVNLWIAFLEFIIISSLLDKVNELSFEYIEEVSKKRKFLFTASKDNWIKKLEEIFKSDFRGLKKGGCIIISSNEHRARLSPKPHRYASVISNIGRVSTSDLMVDAAIRNPAKDFNIMHLTGLHEVCVINNEELFSKYYSGNDGFDVEEMMEIFKEIYRENI